MLYALGFDPDLHKTAGAIVAQDDQGLLEICSMRVFSPPVKLKGQQAAAAMCAYLSVEAARWVNQIRFQFPVQIIVAEGQRIHGGANATRNWDSITALGPVSGACVAATVPAVGGKGLRVSIPTPDEWTRGVPKHVRQARMWKMWDEPYEVRGSAGAQYAVPMTETTRVGFNVGEWKHLGDAVGLALWGLSQLQGGSLPVADEQGPH